LQGPEGLVRRGRCRSVQWDFAAVTASLCLPSEAWKGYMWQGACKKCKVWDWRERQLAATLSSFETGRCKGHASTHSRRQSQQLALMMSYVCTIGHLLRMIPGPQQPHATWSKAQPAQLHSVSTATPCCCMYCALVEVAFFGQGHLLRNAFISDLACLGERAHDQKQSIACAEQVSMCGTSQFLAHLS